MTLADWDGTLARARERRAARGASRRLFRASAFDLAVSLVLAPPILVVCAAVATMIWLQADGPVLFRQERIGRHGRPFTCLKFRTMRCDAETALEALLAADPRLHHQWAVRRKLTFDPRATALGRLLRRFGLDELPQVLNILNGEMSWVGPRPIVEAERDRYGRRFVTYVQVRPGLTGLWQVSRRNVRYSRRVAMDVVYVRRRSLWTDVGLLLRTPAALLLGRGAA